MQTLRQFCHPTWLLRHSAHDDVHVHDDDDDDDDDVCEDEDDDHDDDDGDGIVRDESEDAERVRGA